MSHSRRAAAIAAIVLIASMRPANSNAQELPVPGDSAMPADATIVRVFLTDGTSLISYGEPARVGDRVVFSMPTSASMWEPHLHLVNLSSGQVDWTRTERYAESARAARYLAFEAERDYGALTDDIAETLNEVSNAGDPLQRLRVVEAARKRLAEWPARHFSYRQEEIRGMVAMLDEAIAELRAAIGTDQFDLNLVAMVELAAPLEPLMPLPTPQEAIQLVLTAARLSESSAERVSLMTAVLAALDRDGAHLPDDWTRAVRVSTRAAIGAELAIDRKYRDLTARAMNQVAARSRSADVKGVEAILTDVQQRDHALGARRPEAMMSLVASIESHLQAARELRLMRDRWALRLPELRRYTLAISPSVGRFRRQKSSLEDIRGLAGSSPGALASIERASAQALEVLASVVPPDEFRVAHALTVSALQMADRAARMRREAALSGDMARAWDAASAAAGALMLEARARTEIQALFRIPQLPQ
jgi:hypothetical protein